MLKTLDRCTIFTFWFIFAHKNVAHKKNNQKREAALKNEVAGDEKRVFFFTWPYSLI